MHLEPMALQPQAGMGTPQDEVNRIYDYMTPQIKWSDGISWSIWMTFIFHTFYMFHMLEFVKWLFCENCFKMKFISIKIWNKFTYLVAPG